WNGSPQRELTTKPLSGKLGADHRPRRGAALITAASILAIAGVIAVSVAANEKGHKTAPTCLNQFITWREGGGLSDMQAVTKTLRGLSRADFAVLADSYSAASLSRLGAEAAALQAAAQAAQADPAPACVPGLRADEGTAMSDFTQTAQSTLDAVQALQDGDNQTASNDLKASNSTMDAGSRAIIAATTDVKSFSAG
ncbi:MAG TPA: hypothetical protein VNF47_18065, partial [Streptosporangiaceae bacterium]|nr:hypothetical protein [Streptosporangiaceae bacterium]